MPKIDNWEDWDEVEEQTQIKQNKEKTNGKVKKKKGSSNDKKVRTHTKSYSR